jgi:ABC-type transporter Mla subunit MlaD
MKAALIAALPSSRYRDNARAIGLLDEIQRDKRVDSATQSLAALLKDYATERQKSDDNAAKLAQKAKDEQQRADDLQQKLDDLRNIEKTLIERNQPTHK